MIRLSSIRQQEPLINKGRFGSKSYSIPRLLAAGQLIVLQVLELRPPETMERIEEMIGVYLD